MVRARIWAPALKRLGLPAVTPHLAHHSFISTMQAQGMEVGLVAKLAGHKGAMVTLSHYTHAMRKGEDAVQALDKAYGARMGRAPHSSRSDARQPTTMKGFGFICPAGPDTLIS